MFHPLSIGLVYNLREDYLALGYSMEDTAEFDTISSISALAASLEEIGHRIEHVGDPKTLVERLTKGATWDLIFSMAEGLSGRNREAQVPAILELFDQPYVFSDALTMAISLDKDVAKRLIRDAGIPTAPFLLVHNVHDKQDDLASWSHFPAFVKPCSEGTSKGCELDSKVEHYNQLLQAIENLLRRFSQPVLIEEYLPGREFTVGILGNGNDSRVIGVAEVTMGENADQGVFTLRNKEDQDALCSFNLVEEDVASRIIPLALAAYRCLGCRDLARIDFRLGTDGTPFFLEANPIVGLHPTNSDLPVLAHLHGMPYNSLIENIVRAAASRYDLVSPRKIQVHPQ